MVIQGPKVLNGQELKGRKVLGERHQIQEHKDRKDIQDTQDHKV